MGKFFSRLRRHIGYRVAIFANRAAVRIQNNLPIGLTYFYSGSRGRSRDIMSFHDQDRQCDVILSEAKDLSRCAQRSFASLRMTGLMVPADPLADLDY